MSGAPAYCDSCGAVFPTRAVGFGPGASIKIQNNIVQCGNCGQPARIIDGTFAVSADDVLVMLSGPPLSRAVLESFSGLIHRAAKNEIAFEELESTAAALDPVLGKLVAIARTKGFGIAGLVLIALFLASRMVHLDAKLDINRLFDQWLAQGRSGPQSPSVAGHNKVEDVEKRKAPSRPKSHGNRAKKKKGTKRPRGPRGSASN